MTIAVVERVGSSYVNNIGITSIFAATAAVSIIAAPIASAEAEAEATVQTQTLGSQGKLVDGTVIQGWTISNLKPSTDIIPHPVRGTLWEATATDQAIQGSVTPIVSNLNARASDGETYRALFGAATPQGVNPSTLSQGQETSGKVYFDVTGTTPDSVVYNAGGRDLLVWTQPPASSSSTSSSSTSYGSGSYSSEVPATATPAEAPATEAPEGTPAAPAATGSQGTPLPEGSQGTPLPAGSQGT
ncbi:MAG TPA: MPT63 family protein, partial [Mycobacterium sp.]|nr:MPT63 family protein [Mycobacterium sp.]